MKICNLQNSNADMTTTTTYFATSEGLMLNFDHIETIHAIEEFYIHHDSDNINLRTLTDALDEKFHHKGGLMYLYTLFPDGPITQGCEIAGLTPPRGSIDKGFGSAA